MAKKKPNKPNNKKIYEKQISARLRGFDFVDYEMHNLKGIDLYRYAMNDVKSGETSPKKIKLISQIKFIENRIIENQMNILADELLLEKLQDELSELDAFTDEDKQKLINAIDELHNEFMNDESIKDEAIKMDISQFYEIKRSLIEYEAQRIGVDYEFVIEIYDKYLEEMDQQSVLGDVIGSGINGC